MISSMSTLNSGGTSSYLEASSTLSPKGGRSRHITVATLMLTSLVDAFSILVIYLLVSMSNSGEMLYLNKDTELPQAENTNLLERNTLVKIQDGKLFVEEQEIQASQLVATLLEVRKKWQESRPGEEFPAALTIQADKEVEYEELNAIVLSGSHAGFSEINFAVLQR